jgi:superfamily II DNA or RNA helicase
MDSPGTEHTKTIMKALTYKIKKDVGNKQFQAIETIKNYKILTKGIISIPQGRTDLIPEGYEIVDKRVNEEVPFPSPKFPLRPEQQVVYDEIEDTVFINALVGWGKTFTALHLAHKFGQKTLVITHTAELRDQWAGEIGVLFGTECGIIGGGRLDYEDHFITVANVQTLVKHTDILAKEFGTIILDEAHHCPATTFASIIDSFHARYRIALSGTMVRKDGKHIVFKDYFGSHVVKPPQSHTLTPTVRIIKSGITLTPGKAWTEKITNLTTDEDYQKFISIVALKQMEKGHQVLIIADRVEFLQKVKEYVGESCVLVTGEQDSDARKLAKEQLLSKEKMCVAGSRQIVSEGWSVNTLSCVILAVPISNDSLLEQIIGRIQRMDNDKLEPLVLDIQFAGYADRKQNNDRMGLYLRKGWNVQMV